MKVRFGIGLGSQHTRRSTPRRSSTIWSPAGSNTLWFSELVYSPAVDPTVGMAYALARTTRLKVGTSVAVLPGRHPVLVAKQLASLAALAPKRVLPVFGLQSAIPAEREVFTVPEGKRGAVFDESLRILRAVLVDESASYAGRYFSVTAAAVAPRPDPPLDIWLGGPHRRRSGESGRLPTAGWAASSLPTRRGPAARRSNGPRRTPAGRSNPITSASRSPCPTASSPRSWPPRCATAAQTSTPRFWSPQTGISYIANSMATWPPG